MPHDDVAGVRPVTLVRTQLRKSRPHMSTRSYAYLPSARRSVAAHPSVPLSYRALISCHAVTSPTTPRPVVGHAARPSRSLAPLTPPWPLGRTCRGPSGLPRPCQGHPRARQVLVVLVRRGSPPAPTPTAGINRPGFPLPYVAYVCFKCFRRFRCMLQLFHFDVAKVDRWMLQVF